MNRLKQDDCKATMSKTSLKWYRCEIDDCDVIFAYKNSNNKHVREMHLKRFQCEIKDCEAIYSYRANLNKHVNDMHSKFVYFNSLFMNTTTSNYTSSLAAKERIHKIFEDFSLIDLHSRLDLDSNDSIINTSISKSSWIAHDYLYASFLKENSLRIMITNSSKNDQFITNRNESSKKRKTSLFNDRLSSDRIIRARLSQLISQYEVKQSRINLEQQKVIDWLSQTKKLNFEQIFETFIKRWEEIKFTHQRTCVLCSKNWRVLTLFNLINVEHLNFLLDRQTHRLTYNYSNHNISFTRVVAWFRDDHWSRTNVHLDNFLKCDSFKLMKTSHLCHQEHCIIHFYYEIVDINSNRKNCAI